MGSEAKADFDLEIVLKGLQRCKQQDGTILIEDYLYAFTELCRFFKLMGSVFGFVSKDLESKIDILHQHQAGEKETKYETIQSMIDYEVSNKLTKSKTKLPSGSRTLLRLHRSLEFIVKFMDRMVSAPDDSKSSAIAVEVYEETLAHYHVWLVRKMAAVAMYTLPSRRDLMYIMCKHKPEIVEQLLKQVVEAAMPVYDITQKVYKDRELLDLP